MVSMCGGETNFSRSCRLPPVWLSVNTPAAISNSRATAAMAARGWDGPARTVRAGAGGRVAGAGWPHSMQKCASSRRTRPHLPHNTRASQENANFSKAGAGASSFVGGCGKLLMGPSPWQTALNAAASFLDSSWAGKSANGASAMRRPSAVRMWTSCSR